MTAETRRIRCAWCETELAPGDAKPIKYARLNDRPDAENMQCRDDGACRERQDRLVPPHPEEETG